MSQDALDAHDTEGDLHKRMVSSKTVEVRVNKFATNYIPMGCPLTARAYRRTYSALALCLHAIRNLAI